MTEEILQRASLTIARSYIRTDRRCRLLCAGSRIPERYRVAAPVGSRICVYKSIGISISIPNFVPVAIAVSDTSSLAATNYQD
jgi:hypothetical protein